MANKIKDFGEKIGGAKKDLYAALADGSLDDVEKQKYVRKDKIWPPYKAEKLVSSGIPRDVAFWRNEIRKTVPSKPAPGVPAEWYVKTVTKVRDLVDSVDTPEKAGDFRKSLSAFIVLDEDRKHYWTLPEASGTVTQKLVNAAYTGFHVYRAKAEQELYGVPAKEKEILLLERQFGVFRVGKEIYAEKDNYGRTVAVVPTGSGKEYYYPDRSQMEYDPSTWVKGRYAVINRHYRKIISNSFLTSGDASECMENLVKAAAAMNRENRKKRKGAFPVPELRAVRREGPDYRHSRHASGKYFMEHFGIRGGEFGNWMDDATAQESMDKCYDAFHDLARILGIHPHDISLPEEGNRALAIAFGSRGRGRAMAHYEPAGKVINLTKYRGMGCLAHEWGHALDDYTGFRCGVRTGKTGSMARNSLLPF